MKFNYQKNKMYLNNRKIKIIHPPQLRNSINKKQKHLKNRKMTNHPLSPSKYFYFLAPDKLCAFPVALPEKSTIQYGYRIYELLQECFPKH